MEKQRVLFLLLLFAAVLLCGCGRAAEAVPPAEMPSPSPENSLPAGEEQPRNTPAPGETAAPETIEPEHVSNLYCLAASEEEAREIAGLYGIELLSYSTGVARFYTPEDPGEVIRRGAENGWPLLSPDGGSQLF